MKFKGSFPAVTAWRLAMVAIAVSLLTPIAWAIWWVPVSKKVPAMLQGRVPSVLWETWPLALFPAGFALVTYLMFQAGMMKSPGRTIQYPLRPDLTNQEYYERIDNGRIRPLR
ncbi:MAG: hypothetical protein ACLPVW_03800 [Terriglobales bacterium]